MNFGWSGTILRVDLSSDEVVREKTAPYARKYLGGRGINHAILSREVPPSVHAYDPENLLIFGLGTLAGAFVPNPGRTQITFKSPYPSGCGDSNTGGHWGPEVKYAGYDNIVIKGKAEKPVYLWIDDDRVEIRDAAHVWGKDRYEAEELIRQELGDEDIKIMSIGQGGENMVRFANIMNDLTNAAGRTGGGAVMGSKKLKAIAVRGTKGVRVADPKGLIDLTDMVCQKIMHHPFSDFLGTLGTAGGLELVGTTGMLPIKNFHECGIWEDGAKIGGKVITKQYQVTRSACMGCIIHCHCAYNVNEGKFPAMRSGGPEYETLAALGSRCLCDDVEAVLYMNGLCNKYGIDTVSTGGSLALLMDLYDQGIITEKDTDGIPMVWGDADAMIAMTHKIAKREGIGDKLAEDQIEFAKYLGIDPEKHVIHNKGLPPTGVEIRAATATALSFCVSSRGAHHLSGIPTSDWIPNPALGKRLTGHAEAADPRSYYPEAKSLVVRYYENLFILLDSLGICKIMWGHGAQWHDNPQDIDLLEETLCKYLKVVTGQTYTWSDLEEIADRVFTLERQFITDMGMSRKDDQPCSRDLTEDCPGYHPVGPVPLPAIEQEKFDAMLDAYYQLRGWNKEGVPTKKTLKKLGIVEEE